MQEITIVTKVDNQQAVNAQVGLRKEIKNLKLELEGLNEGTQEYNSTFMKLSNAMKEQKDRMAALRNSSADLGDVIGNTTRLAAGIAGGFQAAQGAMALFGIESEDLQKTLVKVQAFASITQGLAQLEELTKVIPNLISNVKGYFSQLSEGSRAIQTTSKIASDSVAASSSNLITSNTAVAGSTTAVGGSVASLSNAYKEQTNAITATLLAKKTELETNLELITSQQLLNKEEIGNLFKKEEELSLITKLSNKEKAIAKEVDENMTRASNRSAELSNQYTKTKTQLDGVNNKLDVFKEQIEKTGTASEIAGKSSGKFATGLKGIGTSLKSVLSSILPYVVAIGLIVVSYKAISQWLTKTTAQIKLNGKEMEVSTGIAENMAEISSEFQKEANKNYGETLGKYELLKNGWLQLKTAHEKKEFLKNNSKSLNDLSKAAFGSSKSINSISDAQDLLVYKSTEFRRAMIKNAEIMAYQSALVKLNSDLLVQRAETDTAFSKLSIDNSTENEEAATKASEKWYATYLTLENLKGKLKSLDLTGLNLDKSTNKDSTTKTKVIKGLDDVTKSYISFVEKNKKVKDNYLEYEINAEISYWERIESLNSTNYDLNYELGKKHFDTLYNLKEQQIIDNKNFSQQEAIDEKERLLKEIKNGIKEVEGSSANSEQKKLLIEEYNKESLKIKENYNITVKNIDYKFNNDIDKLQQETYNGQLGNTNNYYKKLIEEVDKNNEILLNKMSTIFNDIKTNFANKQDTSLLNTLFNINPNELEKQLAEITSNITEAQNNINKGTSKKDILNKELNDILTTAERRKEIELEITNIEKEQSDARVSIAEYEAEKRKAINENIIAISEGSMQATSSLFQSVIDNNDASYAESEKRYKEQLESGIITKDQYDKKLLAAQQKQNEKNKKWQAGIAMIDGIGGAVKALAGAMSLGPIAGPIVGGIEAAAIMASTVASIRKIYAEKVSDSSSGGSVSSASVAAISAPLNYSTNVTTQSQEQKLNQPMKVYVVESDITTAQTKARVVQSETTF